MVEVRSRGGERRGGKDRGEETRRGELCVQRVDSWKS